MPCWVQTIELRPFYVEARRRTKETGQRWSVDHIVPLMHPLVCGLHCPANFEIILLDDNVHKANSWWPDMPETQAELWT
jgi:hypothetical protein